MNSLREYALESWAREQERRNHSERKKRKRRAKKIEEDIDDLLPRGAEGLQLERNLDDPRWEAVVTVTDTEGSLLRFTYDDEGELSLIGECPVCNQEAMSPAIESAADLGELLEEFAPASSHDCKPREK
jgi:YD repeat-containing protein